MFRDLERRPLVFLATFLTVAGVAAGSASALSPCGPSEFVERGDTLFGIAQRCGTTVEALQEANPRLDPTQMRVGMRIAMPTSGGATSVAKSASRPTPYSRVSALARMAERAGVPVQALIAKDDDLVAAEVSDGAEAEYSPDPGDEVEVAGRLTDEGAECPVLRSSDGTLYSLAGKTDGFGPGDDVLVSGAIADMSMCMQGTTVEVERISAAD